MFLVSDNEASTQIPIYPEQPSAFSMSSEPNSRVMHSASIIPWRWDQGRLAYFAFGNVRLVASALCKLENMRLSVSPDPLKSPLITSTGLSFRAGASNSTWRNYARVFESCLLATQVDGRLICTELAHRLCSRGESEMSADDYFAHFIKRFYYPSPVFQGYAAAGPQTFPGCAVIRFLLARLEAGKEPKVSIEEVLSCLVGNQCVGDEPLDFYRSLIPSRRRFSSDAVRQVRELIIFLSQLTILKWNRPNLYLDIEDSLEARRLTLRLATPSKRPREAAPAKEILALGRTGDLGIIALPIALIDASDEFIREGGRKSVTHLTVERSSRLRSFLFSKLRPPFVCDICSIRPSASYPWTPNLLEVHHLLPLSSPVRVTAARTSLDDLVPLCPNCHKATHSFYRRWLKAEKRDDFGSRAEAKTVYDMVKTEYEPN